MSEMPVLPPHPNDAIVFQQYPDPVRRMTYPPIPTRGGNRNAVATQAVLSSIIARHPDQQLPVLSDPMPEPLATPLPDLPQDPDLEPYRQAGWM